MPSIRLLALLILVAASLAITNACMAMVPTDPALTRPPPVTTTAAAVSTTTTVVTSTSTLTTTTTPTPTTSATTTSSTTTTTASTTTAPTCTLCAPVFYKIPEPGICAEGQTHCADESLLILGTMPCKTASCKGATLFVGDGIEVTGQVTCAATTPAGYVDDAKRPFPDGTPVFCGADISVCSCPSGYTMNQDALPEETLVDSATLGKYGCPIKNCGAASSLQYAADRSPLGSMTCNPTMSSYVEQNGDVLLTGQYACYAAVAGDAAI